DGGEGVNDEEDRREDEQQFLEKRDHSATCTTRSFPARFASYIASSARRSSSSTPRSAPSEETRPMLAVTEGVPRNTFRFPAARRVAAACSTDPLVPGISLSD